MIERASAVQLRKALEMANHFVKAGIDFVPMPAANEEEKRALLDRAITKLDAMELDAACAERSGDHG